MMQEYRSKTITAEKAAALVQSGSWIDYGFALSSNFSIDKALSLRAQELEDVKIRGGMYFYPECAAIEADPCREHFIYNSWHFSGYERKLHDRGLCSLLPMVYRNKPRYYRKGLQVDVAYMMLSAMDDKGYFSVSFTNSATRAIAETAKILVVEVNPHLPGIPGIREDRIHLSEVDYIVETHDLPLPTLPPAPFGDVERKIAGFIIKELTDGITLQLGVGSLPNAVGSLIVDSDLKDIGMHTEML
jgi:acyl-CoA hydrolase